MANGSAAKGNESKNESKESKLEATHNDDHLVGTAGDDKIKGKKGDDAILGAAGDDRLYGDQGNDILIGGRGNDVIDGGSGSDTAIFSGSIFDYDFSTVQTGKSGGKGNGSGSGDRQLTYVVSGQDGTDTLQNVEALQFDDYTYYLDDRPNSPFTRIDSGETDEDSSAIIDVLSNDLNVEEGPMVVTEVSGAEPGATVSTNGTLVTYNTGTAWQHLSVGETATDELTYRVENSTGASSLETVLVTITGTNDGPVAEADEVSTAENSAITLDVLSNDTDVDQSDSHTLDFVAVLDAGTASAAVSVSRDNNQLKFDPGTAFDHLSVGEEDTVTVEYVMSDNHGASSTSQATITIIGTNDGPKAISDSASTNENTVVILDVLSNDTDVDQSDTHKLDTVEVLNAGSANGPVSVSIENNQLKLDSGTAFDHLSVGEEDIATVEYVMSDNHGASSTSQATITVIGSNDAPNAVVDSATTDENTAILLDVLVNDSDVDQSDTLSLASVEVVDSGTAIGAFNVSIVNDQLFFEPGTAFDHLALSEQDSVTIKYVVKDNSGTAAEALATITITGLNDSPTAVDDALSVSVDVSSIDVLSNDIDVDQSDTLMLKEATIVSSSSSSDTASSEESAESGSEQESGSAGESTASGSEQESGSALESSESGTEQESGSAAESTASGSEQESGSALESSESGTEQESGSAAESADSGSEQESGAAQESAESGSEQESGSAQESTEEIAASVSIENNELVFDPGTEFDYLEGGEEATVVVEYQISDNHGELSTAHTTITIVGSTTDLDLSSQGDAGV